MRGPALKGALLMRDHDCTALQPALDWHPALKGTAPTRDHGCTSLQRHARACNGSGVVNLAALPTSLLSHVAE